MLALTLKQPYAWMVIFGSKDIENRSWVNSVLQGLIDRQEEFAIHAGLDCTKEYYRQAVEFARAQDPELEVPKRQDLLLGALIGTVIPVRVYTPEDWTPQRPWHMPDQNGWQLQDRKPLVRAIAMRGRQGFWKLDEKIARQVWATRESDV